MNVRTRKSTRSFFGIGKDHHFDLDTNSHRHSLYEPPAHHTSKVKRTEPIHTPHSAGTNHTITRSVAHKDRHLSKEGEM